MGTKTFTIVTAISMVLTLIAALLSLLGISLTGFYPGIIVLLLLSLIPIASILYARNRRSHYTLLTIINVLLILIVLWMAFVIVHDRVLQDCC